MRGVLVLCAALILAPDVRATTCREACLKARANRKKQLRDCIKEANKAPRHLRAKARVQCRRRTVIPGCEGRPPCPEGEHQRASIEIITHYFSTSKHGKPMRKAVFAPGETLFMRYQGVLSPASTAGEIRLQGDVVLRQGKRVLVRRDEELKMRKRLTDESRDLLHKFDGRVSFELAPDLKPGEYAVELQLRDEESEVDAVRGYRFQVVSKRPSGARPKP